MLSQVFSKDMHMIPICMQDSAMSRQKNLRESFIVNASMIHPVYTGSKVPKKPINNDKTDSPAMKGK